MPKCILRPLALLGPKSSCPFNKVMVLGARSAEPPINQGRCGARALSTLPLLFVEVDGATFKQEHGSGFFAFFRKAPMLLFAVSAATLFDNVFISFFTIFGLRHGLELDTASRILGVGIIGNVLMFYPIGWLANH